ncbi:MAG: hypothetical protein IT374_18595 [Polyangiaceae bacterium]|nr:hypothetical protein [Polyangiaceae bacterium]
MSARLVTAKDRIDMVWGPLSGDVASHRDEVHGACRAGDREIAEIVDEMAPISAFIRLIEPIAATACDTVRQRAQGHGAVESPARAA